MAEITDTGKNDVEIVTDEDEIETALMLGTFDGPRMWDNSSASPGANIATRYSEGNVVQTPQGLGVVTEVRTESFEGTDGEVGASEDSPTYVVGLKDARVGVGFYAASELTPAEMPDTGVEDPISDVGDQTANTAADRLLRALNLRSNDWSMPRSWREADKPARLILLDAWQSMGGTFRGARRELGSNRLAAAMKDEVLGGWEGWREGG